MQQSAHHVFLLLGSNLGDRVAVMQAALEQIVEKVGRLEAASLLYETAPWGITDQPAFLNQVVEIETALDPEAVLRIVLDIEHALGRVRYQRWGARVIDIDMLYFDNLIIDSARLTLPHPRLHERRFTLIPLAEIAPDLVHPVWKQTSLQMLDICQDNNAVEIFS